MTGRPDTAPVKAEVVVMGLLVFSLVAIVLVMFGMAVFWPTDRPSRRLLRFLRVAVDVVRAWRWPGPL